MEVASVFDTRSKLTVLEVSNTLNSAIDVDIRVFDASGVQISVPLEPVNFTATIPARGNRHIVLNSLIENGVGNIQLAPLVSGLTSLGTSLARSITASRSGG